MTPLLGLTLPTFHEDPEVLVGVARAAEAAGVDGVFTYDHLYRVASGAQGPALSLEPVLGLLAVETDRISFGPFMARATIRRAPVLRSVLDTVLRIAGPRLIAGMGSGDSLSDPENEMFGVPTGPAGGRVAVRMSALQSTVEALRGRGYPVWVGGRSDRILATAAAAADGWNGWNLTSSEFVSEVERLRAACEVALRPADDLVVTWGGLVELRPDKWKDAADRPDVLGGSYEQIADSLRSMVDAGASWVVVGPVASAEPENAAILIEEIAPLLT